MVSEIGLGTNNLGTRLFGSEASIIVRAALDLGITLFDTADLYGAGQSEELLGKGLRGKRQDVLIATKVGHPVDGTGTTGGASRRWITQAIDGSLRRLGTDWIDVYQLHTPDQSTPISETLGVLSELVQAGKVRYVGTSNFAAWELVDAAWTARTEHRAKPVAAQYVWNLLEREVEGNILPALRHLGLGLIAARPLAYGFLTGKFEDGRAAEGARLPSSKRASDFLTRSNFEQLAGLQRFAADRGHSILELAFAYLLTQPTVSSVIASASSRQQLEQNVASSHWRLDTSDLDSLIATLPSVAAGQPRA
jgi:aryl-alcohol dehydrogenase-like predicted oxidoreductase